MKRLSTVLLISFIALTTASAKKSTAYTCTLTNKKIASCCCTKKEGKLYCKLAKKTIENCCCKSADASKTNGR